jgi:hypothetical protein
LTKNYLTSGAAPSPACGGYFPMNGEEQHLPTSGKEKRKGRRPGGSQDGVATLTR